MRNQLNILQNSIKKFSNLLKKPAQKIIQNEVDSLEKELKLILDLNINYTQLNKIDKIIKRLNEINPKPNSFSIEEAWKDFEKNYLPKI